jgi:hypothetical protein
VYSTRSDRARGSRKLICQSNQRRATPRNRITNEVQATAAAFRRTAASGTFSNTCTVFRFVNLLEENLICPGVSAYSVWSFPCSHRMCKGLKMYAFLVTAV